MASGRERSGKFGFGSLLAQGFVISIYPQATLGQCRALHLPRKTGAAMGCELWVQTVEW